MSHRRLRYNRAGFITTFALLVGATGAQAAGFATEAPPTALYQFPEGVQTRWASPENWLGEKGGGAQARGSRKGSPSFPLPAGEYFKKAAPHLAVLKKYFPKAKYGIPGASFWGVVQDPGPQTEFAIHQTEEEPHPWLRGILKNQDSDARESTHIGYSEVRIQDAFWQPKIDRIGHAALPALIAFTEKEGTIRNFENAGKPGLDRKHEGMFYRDSDAYKILEAIAYSLERNPDPVLGKKADEWIAIMAQAQEPDGYINTFYSLTGLAGRWTNMNMHEDYCAGHLIEAGIAYYQVTGKRALLDVGIKMADHIASVFGPEKRSWVPGHQEIELALVKLHRLTGQKKYLDLAEWFLDQRGQGLFKGSSKKPRSPEYFQDDVPLVTADNVTGHAVRAMYYYTGAGDVTKYAGTRKYLPALQKIWEDVVYRNMYITGGIGAAAENEGFGKDYDLPNREAYCETCASVGMVFWNHRMNELTGDAKYMDILERSLYNAALAGISLEGDLFFYSNPLASYGDKQRQEGFRTDCCPPNISRLTASVGNYIYAKGDSAVWVNLFVGSETDIATPNGHVDIRQRTDYPWSGNVNIAVNPEPDAEFSLYVRIPGWAGAAPVPGTLYSYLEPGDEDFHLQVNGTPADFKMERGYASITRNWQKGDEVELALPVRAKRVVASNSVVDNINKVALQRGPLVYCIESVDNDGNVFDIALPDDAAITARWNPNLLGGVMVLNSEGMKFPPATDGAAIESRKFAITAIPYHAWANRGKDQMRIWIPRGASMVDSERSR